MASRHVALLTDSRYTACDVSDENWYLGNILQEDALLSAALAHHEITTVRVAWSDPSIDWTQFAAIVFRSTWDYFDRIEEFRAWLQRVESLVPAINTISTIRWNLDKHYLADLQARGVRIVDSQFVEHGSTQSLCETVAGWDTDEIVVKPCVSGAARHTYRLQASDLESWEARWRTLIEAEAMIVQPFQTDIVLHGETTLVVLNGHVTHAVRKVAKPGDFRVQDDHGGTVHPHVPSDEERAFAEFVVRQSGVQPAYARVDLTRNARQELCVMELELIEPELWLRFCPEAAMPFALAIATQLNRLR